MGNDQEAGTQQDPWTSRREVWRLHPDDARDDFAVDHDRVVHSGSFRRLQGKTQILNLGESDFYRTRLTHTMEVARIANNVTRQLFKALDDDPAAAVLPGADLIQAIALTHDLGHPPFGHGGEVALNYCMRDHGGFEGNGQTMRILSRLEKFSRGAGANLTRRTMLGALKYPVAHGEVANVDLKPRLRTGLDTLRLIDRGLSKPPKCYMDCERPVVEWILEHFADGERDEFTRYERRPGKHAKALHKSLDCSIMDAADDIAYGVHDLEDAIALRLVEREAFEHHVPREACAPFLEIARTRYAGEGEPYASLVGMLFGDGGGRKRAIGRLVHFFVTHVDLQRDERFEEPLLRHRAALEEGARPFLDALQALVRAEVIGSPGVQQLEFKGQRLVVAVFEAMLSEPDAFLPLDTRRTLDASPDGAERVICDHVAGMSDAFLLKTYDRLFSPRMGSVFDKL